LQIEAVGEKFKRLGDVHRAVDLPEFERQLADLGQASPGGSAGRGSRGFFVTPPEHLLTSFHTILNVEFGGHLSTSPSC
jgi:hypothetical protein